MKKNIKVTLNGKTVYGYEGQQILDLCAECGVEIPSLCYDPHLSLHGGCSVCLVEVEGAKTLLRACANTISQGMIIRTDTPRALNARRTALELILSDHVGDCRPPCTLTCPANGNVQAYINLAAQGKYRESLDVLHHHVTLPACIGRVCPAPCEKKCRRNFVDETAVSIKEIKRFVGDWGIRTGNLGFIPEVQPNGRSAAIVGGGPAGLSAAYYLRLKGFRVVIFEKELLLGGMMRYGIPDYRLPQKVLQTEIDWLLAHGVEVRTGVALGKDISLEQLRKEFDGVILAMGCWKSSPMKVPGENLEGVLGGINFLYDVKTNSSVKIGRRVAVIGGGNTAMDACRTAKRLGAEEVSVLYRRSREEMPADDLEIEEAMEEGVKFIFLAAPKAISGNGRVETLECEKMMLGEPDASGRRSPVPTGETFSLSVDTVIAAVGQAIDFSSVPAELHDGKRMKIGKDYETPLPGVFVCGDQQSGPKIAIEAIGNGHWAADSLEHYLTKGKPKKPFFYDIVQTDLGPEDFRHVERTVREKVPHVTSGARLAAPFQEYSTGLSEDQTLRDASRCMECGCADVFECRLRKFATTHEVQPEKFAGAHVQKFEDANEYYVRNMDKCILCGRCVRACDEVAGFHAIDFAKRGFESILTPHFFRKMEDSDCTFCGLCTQVCPVGALMEKRAERWPHLEVPEIVKTTCQLCPVGCELDLNLDRGRTRIVRVTTDPDNPVAPAFGLCCVKGRYWFKQAEKEGDFPPSIHGSEVTSDEALSAFDALASTGRTAFVVSSSLTREELKAVRDYASKASPEGMTAATEGAELLPFADEAPNYAAAVRAPYASLLDGDGFLLLWSRTDEEQPVLTSLLRRGARHRKAPVVYIGDAPGILEKGEAVVLRPEKGTEARVVAALSAALKALAKKATPELEKILLETALKDTGVSARSVEKAARLLSGAKHPVTLMGSAAPAAESLDAAASLPGGRYILLFSQANTAEVLSVLGRPASMNDVRRALLEGKTSAAVFLGTTPEEAGFSAEHLEGTPYAVLSSATSSLSEKADVFLPLLPWTEKEGTLTNLEGRPLQAHRGPLAVKRGRSLCALLSWAALPRGGRIPANPVAQ